MQQNSAVYFTLNPVMHQHKRPVGSLEYWRNLLYAVRRRGMAQRTATSDLLTLNPELNLHTYKSRKQSSWRVPAESCATCYLHRRLWRHTSFNLQMNYWRHTTPTMFFFFFCIGWEWAVAPEYKDCVALEFEGWIYLKLFKIVNSPLMHHLLSPGAFLPPRRLFSKGSPPTHTHTRLNHNFHAPAHCYTFPFLGKLLQFDLSVLSGSLVKCYFYYLSWIKANQQQNTLLPEHAATVGAPEVSMHQCTYMLNMYEGCIMHPPAYTPPPFFFCILLMRMQDFTMQE